MMSWNLNLENNELTRGFQEMIDRMRKTQGIPNPHPNIGKRRRPFGWRDVELMDIQQLRLRPLDDAETSQVSKAKAEFSKAEATNRNRKSNTEVGNRLLLACWILPNRWGC